MDDSLDSFVGVNTLVILRTRKKDCFLLSLQKTWQLNERYTVPIIIYYTHCTFSRVSVKRNLSVQYLDSACGLCYLFQLSRNQSRYRNPMYYEVVVSKTLELLPLFWKDSNFEYSSTLQLALYYCYPVSLKPSHVFFCFNQKFYPRMFRCTLVYHMAFQTMWWPCSGGGKWQLSQKFEDLVGLPTTWRIIPVIK